VLSAFGDPPTDAGTPAEGQAQAALSALPPTWIAAGLAGTVLLLLTYHLVAAKSSGCAAARALDLT
jgi:hypothetical protein